jgi:iron complex transport system substrate-binding protein
MLVLRPIDGRHVTVFGAHSLFGGVPRQPGMANAWQRDVDLQGFAQTDLSSLGALREARVVRVGVAPPVVAELGRSPLWNALPFVAAGRARQLGLTTCR